MASVRNSKGSVHTTAQSGEVVVRYYDDKGKEIQQKTSSTTIAKSATMVKASQPSSSSSSANQKYPLVDATKKTDLPNKKPKFSKDTKKSDLQFIELAAKSGLPFFIKFPEEVVTTQFLPYLDLANDAKTLNALNTSVQKKEQRVFSPMLELEGKKRVQQLLEHIARGDQVEAEKLIKKHPGLLTLRGTIQTYAEDIIQDVNPLELAYGEDDDDMFKMMLPYLNQLPQKTKADLFNQLKERFPETKEEKYDFAPLVNAITRNDAKAVETELEKFRKDFAPQVLKNGKVITRITQALEQAMQVYIDNYDPWSGDQCSLFWCKAIGYLQRRLSACYAQAHCQGLYNVTDGKQSLSRGLKLGDVTLYFSHPHSSRQGLGFDFGVYSYYVSWRDTGGRDLDACVPVFKTYVEQKRKSFGGLCGSPTVDCQRKLCV